MTETYNYDFKFQWKFTGDVFGTTTDEQALADAEQGMNKLAFEQFSAKLAETGHWYKVNSTTTTLTMKNKRTDGYMGWLIDFSGETILNFDTDVADPNAHNSPQLLAVLTAILAAIALAIIAHPLAFLLIVAIVVFGVVAWSLINTGSGAIYKLGSNAGSLILSLGILAVAGFGIYAGLKYFTGKPRRKSPRRKRR